MRNVLILGGAIVVAIIIGVFVFLYGGSGVSNTSLSSANENRLAAVAVPFIELAQGVQSNISMRTNYLITSASQLEKLWKIVDTNDKIPNVDFTKNYIVAVFAGNEPTTDYAISVSKIEDTDVRTVTVTLVKPGNNCLGKDLTTTPYNLVALPKTSLPFTHEDQAATTDCTR